MGPCLIISVLWVTTGVICQLLAAAHSGSDLCPLVFALVQDGAVSPL